MNAKPENARMQALLEEELAKVREEDEAGKQAEAALANPELQQRLADLKADAPADATGPFVRRVGSLREQRPAQASDKAQHMTAALHTNPVACDPSARVLVGRRSPGASAHVTAPSVVKKQELGLDTPLEVVGRSPSNTLRLGKALGPGAGSAGAEVAVVATLRRTAPWIAAALLLLLSVPLLVIWIVQRDRALGAENSATSSVANRPASATATQIVMTAPIVPFTVAATTTAEQPIATTLIATNTEPVPRSSAAKSAITPATAVAATSAPSSTAIPPTTGTPSAMPKASHSSAVKKPWFE